MSDYDHRAQALVSTQQTLASTVLCDNYFTARLGWISCSRSPRSKLRLREARYVSEVPELTHGGGRSHPRVCDPGRHSCHWATQSHERGSLSPACFPSVGVPRTGPLPPRSAHSFWAVMSRASSQVPLRVNDPHIQILLQTHTSPSQDLLDGSARGSHRHLSQTSLPCRGHLHRRSHTGSDAYAGWKDTRCHPQNTQEAGAASQVGWQD